jgi:Tfp pilus assembly protein PilF
MRAWYNWLAVVPLLGFVGCATLHDRAASAVSPSALTSGDERMAEALAHYSLTLISETTLGGSGAALMHLREASAADPSNLPLALKVAAGHVTRKEYGAAITVIKRTLVHHPHSVEAHLVLGIAYQLDSASRLAEREFRTAMRLDPLASEPPLRLASLYIAGDKPRQALVVVDKALEQPAFKAAFAEFAENMGRLYLLGEQPVRAVSFFERAVQADPDRVAIKGLLARAHMAAGNRHAAMKGLLDLAWRYPEDYQTALSLGELFEEEGEIEKAAGYYERAVKAKPGDTTAVLRLVNILLRTKPADAWRLMEETVRKYPDDPALSVYLGLIYSRLKRFDEAVRLYAKVEAAASKGAGNAQGLKPIFYFWYGSACERAGLIEEAERQLGRCIELDANSDQALNYLAYIWADKGIHLDKALEYATRALALAPGEGAYLDTIGWIHYKKGDYHKALYYLKKAAKVMPDDPVVNDHLGDTWDALKEPGKAQRYWQKSLNLETGKQPPSPRGKE